MFAKTSDGHFLRRAEGQPVKNVLRVALNRWHRAWSATEKRALTYGRLLAAVRPVMPEYLAARLYNDIGTHEWPDVSWPPQTVQVGRETSILLTPHPAEFDREAVLRRRFTYESRVMLWLEPQVACYDRIIEVGANVGVFTCFMAKCLQRDGRRDARILAFEPSPRAFQRLTENVALNELGRYVQPWCGAVSDQTGVVWLYEPRGHLTNGSLNRDFAASFGDVTPVPVMAFTAAEIAPHVPDGARLLIKIDAEGAEPAVLAGLAPLIDSHRPDILLEVLPEMEAQIRTWPPLRDGAYEVLWTDERDWWLTPTS